MTHANKITAIKAIEPARVCKTYALNGDELRKTAIAHITTGVGYTCEVETSQDLIKILKAVTDKPDHASYDEKEQSYGSLRHLVLLQSTTG